MKPSSSSKQDAKTVKRLSEERIRLLNTETPDEAMLAACLEALRKDASERLNEECLAHVISQEIISNDGSNIQLKSRVVALLDKMKIEEKDKFTQQLNDQLSEWRASITLNDFVDVQWEGAWYLCKVKRDIERMR
jgi:hypothetical protein